MSVFLGFVGAFCAALAFNLFNGSNSTDLENDVWHEIAKACKRR